MKFILRYGAKTKEIDLTRADAQTCANVAYYLQTQANRILRRLLSSATLSICARVKLQDRLTEIRGQQDLVTLVQTIHSI